MINTANSGDTIHVDVGIHREWLYIDKDLNLVGKSTSGVIFRPEKSPYDAVIYICNNANVTIKQITTEISPSGEDASILNGIVAKGCTVNLSECKMTGGKYNGAYLVDCDATIDNCIFESNENCGIRGEFGKVTVRNTTVRSLIFKIDITYLFIITCEQK